MDQYQYLDRSSTYLYYGYTIGSSNIDWLGEHLEYEPAKYSYNCKDTSCILDIAIDDLLQTMPNESCIVPISGGWDSRILLGAALERYHANEIKTVSFGVPGQLDYDLGKLVADTAGVEHHAKDLSKVELHWGVLLSSVEEAPWTYVPDAFFNRYSIAQVTGEKDVVLSGFMGDPLTGGHISNARTKDGAVAEFVNKQKRVRNINLAAEDYNPATDLPPLPDNPSIPYSELLDFGIRQANCIAPIVTPKKRWTGWGGNMGRMPSTGSCVLAPFAHPDWAAYWIKAPRDVKQGQKLYLEMMKHKFPKLAALPSKYSLGCQTGSFGQTLAKGRRKVLVNFDKYFPRSKLRYTSHLNYLDYGHTFRKRDDYREVLNEAIGYLQKHDVVPWLNLEKLRRDHDQCKANYSDAFLVLIGLALNLEAESKS